MDSPPFVGVYVLDDPQARRIALAHALRQMADYLEVTAPEAARIEREGVPPRTSHYTPDPPTPTPLHRIGVALERHEESGGRWVAKVWNADA